MPERAQIDWKKELGEASSSPFNGKTKTASIRTLQETFKPAKKTSSVDCEDLLG
jgi:hypothetical protein